MTTTVRIGIQMQRLRQGKSASEAIPAEEDDEGPARVPIGRDKLPVPERPCASCGDMFQPTVKRRLLCDSCFSETGSGTGHAGGSGIAKGFGFDLHND